MVKRKKRVRKRNEGMMLMRRGRKREKKNEKKMHETKTGGTPMRQLPASF